MHHGSFTTLVRATREIRVTIALLTFITALNYLKMVDDCCLMRA